MELTPLSSVLICVRGVVICLQLWWFILGHPALDLSKVSLILFQFLLDLNSTSKGGAKREVFQDIQLILDVFV